MRYPKLLAVALTGLLAIAACTDTAGDGTTTSEGVDVTTTSSSTSSTPAGGTSDLAELMTQMQTEMTTLANEIQNSEAADELQAAWSELESDLSAAIQTALTDGTFDTVTISDSFDEFQSTLDSLGEQVGPEVTEAWNALRSSIEQMMS
jgi:hypothetical protein